MRTTNRWAALAVFLFAALGAACGASLPPITIDVQRPPRVVDPPPSAPKKATLAFEVIECLDAECRDRKPIEGAIVRLDTGDERATNAAGYAKFDGLDAGTPETPRVYGAVVSAGETYAAASGLRYALEQNRQETVRLSRAFVPPAAVAPQNLFIRVVNSARAPIADAYCLVNNERRRADGGGFIHFPVTGSVVATCAAPGYLLKQFPFAPAETEQTAVLDAIPAPASPPLPSTPIDPVTFTACGPRGDPTTGRLACLDQVARFSSNWKTCLEKAAEGQARNKRNADGYPISEDEHPCHLYVREVARALAAGDRRWGMITKRHGESACNATRCGDDLTDGTGEDVVAYLPDGARPNEWLGADILGGMGGWSPSYGWPSAFHPENNRPHNLWIAWSDVK